MKFRITRQAGKPVILSLSELNDLLARGVLFEVLGPPVRNQIQILNEEGERVRWMTSQLSALREDTQGIETLLPVPSVASSVSLLIP